MRRKGGGQNKEGVSIFLRLFSEEDAAQVCPFKLLEPIPERKRELEDGCLSENEQGSQEHELEWPSFSGSVVLPTETAQALKSIEISKSSQKLKVKTADRLKKFLKNWERLTEDNFILECVSGYKIPVLETLNQLDPPLEPVWSKDSFDSIKVAVSRLLSIGAVEICCPQPGQFLLKYCLVNKPDWSKRFILYLKELNNFTYCEHFKLEDLRTAIRLLQCNSFMCNLDLKDAYLVVPVDAESRNFLRFVFDGKLYQFRSLPFGLCTSPYVFTKILKPVMSHLRSRDFLFTTYLDQSARILKFHYQS